VGVRIIFMPIIQAYIIRIALRQKDDSQTDIIPSDQRDVLPSSASAYTPFALAAFGSRCASDTDCIMRLYHLIISILSQAIIFVNSLI